MSRPGPLIFDLDDTLLYCSRYYQQANQRFYERMDTLFEGFDRATVRTLMTEVDVGAAEEGLGYSPDRFPTSMVRTYRRLCRQTGREPRSGVEEELFGIGASVFEAEFPWIEGAEAALCRYREAGHPLALCTKGDPGVQRRKIEKHGLGELFEVIRIIERPKEPRDFVELTDQMGLDDPTRATMVGDSLSEDVEAPGKAGLTTVWVQDEDSQKSDFYRALSDGADPTVPDHVITRVAELPSVVPVPTPPGPARTAAR